MPETRIPGIPSPNSAQFDQAVKQAVEVLLGRVGDPLDRALTVREAVSSGIAKLVSGSTVAGTGGTSSGGGGVISIPSTGVVPDTTPPPIAENVTTSGTIGSIYVLWDVPSYSVGRGHSHSIVLHSKTDNIGTAIKAGQSPGGFFAFSAGDLDDHYFWIQIVSKDGGISPINATAGTLGRASVNPAYILEVIADSVSESELVSTLKARIDLIDTAGTGLVDKVTDLEAVYGSTASAAASAAAAALSESEAIAAKVAALAAQADAETAAASAATSLSAATSQASAAATSASNAASYKTDAESASTAATAAKVAAEAAQAGASGSASAAAGSASVATTKASEAATSASAALTSETNAATSAGSASSSAGSAASSATDAANSESAASTYATNAANSATAAGGSATAAAGSASTASTHATNAGNSATAASSAQVAAESARDTASGHASAAATSASTASTHATNAGTAASSATSSANSASTDAASALAYKNSAATSATDAAGYAAAAATDYSAVSARLNSGGDIYTAIVAAQSTATAANGVATGAYTLKIQTDTGGNRRVAGFGLSVDSGTGSEFAIFADRFYLVGPGADGIGSSPFVHYNSPTTINGVAVPAGTYIANAYIPNGVINKLHFDVATGNRLIAEDGVFGTVLADTVKVKASLIVEKLQANQIEATTLSAITSYLGTIFGAQVSLTAAGDNFVRTATKSLNDGANGWALASNPTTGEYYHEFRATSGSAIVQQRMAGGGSLGAQYYLQVRNSAGTDLLVVDPANGIMKFKGQVQADSGYYSGDITSAATISGASGYFGTITSGYLQNTGNTASLNLNASGSTAYLRAGSKTLIYADGKTNFNNEYYGATISTGNHNMIHSWIDGESNTHWEVSPLVDFEHDLGITLDVGEFYTSNFEVAVHGWWTSSSNTNFRVFARGEMFAVFPELGASWSGCRLKMRLYASIDVLNSHDFYGQNVELSGLLVKVLRIT